MKHAARIVNRVLLLLVVAATVAIMTGCGDSSSLPSSSTGAGSYFGTQSPGDAWSWTITKDGTGSGTFSAKNNTSGNTYSGNAVTLSNKFLQLKITATTDSNVAIGGSGATAYAIEFPNTAIIVKPAGNNDMPVIGAAQGACPSPAAYNWIKVPNGSWNIATDPAFGTAVTTGSTSSLNFSIPQYLLAGTALSTITYSGSCSNGVITTTANTTFGVTPSGVFIGDQGTNGGVVGMMQPSAKIGTTAILQAGREFRGFVFMTHPPDGVDKTLPIWSRTKGDGFITAGSYTNFVNGTEDTCPTGDSCATLSLTNEIAPGLFTGTMTDIHTSTAHAFTLAINQINGKYVVFGFSQEQAGSDPNALYPYLLVVMEQ